MTEDDVRRIVRDEIAKMIDESGILDAAMGLVTDTITGLFPGVSDEYRP